VDLLVRWDDYLIRTGERLTEFTYARWPNRAYDFFPEDSRFPRDPEVLLTNVEFESLVYERGVAAVGLMEQFREMEELRGRIEELLSGELTREPARASS